MWLEDLLQSAIYLRWILDLGRPNKEEAQASRVRFSQTLGAQTTPKCVSSTKRLGASRGPLTDCSDWLDDWLTAVLPADTKGRLCACLQISGLIYKVIHGVRRPVSFFSRCPSSSFAPIPCPKPAVHHVYPIPSGSGGENHPVISLIQMSERRVYEASIRRFTPLWLFILPLSPSISSASSDRPLTSVAFARRS